MYTEEQLDALTNLAFCKLYATFKEEKYIKLPSFEVDNKSHMALLHIANIMQLKAFQKKIIIGTKLFRARRAVKRSGIDIIVNPIMKDGLDITSFINECENALEMPHGFKEIYERYYEK